jgi:hemolysin III
MTTPRAKLTQKPRLRGVSHEIALYASGFAGTYLVSQAHGPGQTHEALIGTTIYSLCIFFMYAGSALYHRPHWSPEARTRMRRVDHSTIFLSIAGTATPVAMLALEGTAQLEMLLTLWIGASLGILKSLLWIKAPKALTAFVYVLIGLSALPFYSQIRAAIGPEASALILYGGGLYVLGAVVYALRRPDPVPTVFGYHEIFHALVIGGSICQYVAILGLVKRVM